MRSSLHRFWDAYALIFPQKRHKAVGKETGKTKLYRAIQLYDAPASFTIGT